MNWRRWLLGGGIVVFALLLVLGCALAWLLNSTGGRDWALQRAVASLPANSHLHWAQAEGNLAGPLTLRGVELAMPIQRDSDCVPQVQIACAMGTLRLHVNTLTLRAAILPLLTRTLRIESLILADVQLDLPRDDTRFKLPKWPDVLPRLDLPLTVQADAIAIDRFAIAQEGERQIILNTVRGGVRVAPGALHIEHLQADTDRGQFSVRGDYRPRDNYRSDLRASAVLPAPAGQSAPQLQLQAQGDLSSLNVNLNGHAPAPLQAHLNLQGPATAPRWQLQANSAALDVLSLAGRKQTATPVALQLSATGVGGSATVHGRFQQGDTTLVLQPSQLSVEQQTLRLHPLVVDAFNGQVRAEGSMALGDAAHTALVITLQAKGLRWRSSDGQTEIAGNANIKLDGTLEQWTALGTAQLQRGGDSAQLAFDGVGNRQAVQLRKLGVRMPQGTLDASGQVAWSPALQWQASAQLAGFDPGYFAPDWPGAITGQLQTHGQQRSPTQGLLAQVQVRDLGGSLRKRALSGSAQLDIDGQTYAGDVALRLGQSHVVASGKLAATLTVDARLEPLQLQDVLPSGNGVLRGSVHLRGARNAPDVEADLSGDALAFGDYRVDRLRAKGRLPWRNGDGALSIDAQGLQLGLPLTALRAQLRGAVAKLQLDAEAHSDTGSVHLRGDASQQANRWQGQLAALQFTPTSGAAWALQQPAHWAWDGRSATLGQACLQASGGGVLCVDADWPRRSVAVQGSALPLALLVPYLPERDDGRPWALRGALALAGEVKPAGNAWRGSATLTSDTGGLRNGPRARRDVVGYRGLRLEASFDPNHIDAQLATALDAGGQLDARISTGFDAHAPLVGAIKLHSSALTWMELLSPDLVAPSGTLDVDVQLAGTRAQPLLGGTAQLQGFAAELPALGISLHDGRVQLAAREDGSATIQGQIGAGDGALQVAGDLDWRSDDTPLQLTLRGNSVLLADTRQLRIVADPDLSLRYRAGQPLQLRGQVTLAQADIHLERLDMGVSPSPDVVVLDPVDPSQTASGLALDMDLNLLMGKAVHLDGYGLQGSLSGGLRVRAQPGRDMLANGALQIEGRYRAYGQNLQITRGGLRWTNTPVDDPLLDIRAERHVGDVTAGIRVEGRAQAPQATVYSDPAKSESEALAYLTLGRPLSALSGNEARQLGAAKAALNAGSGLLAAELGARIGLDDAGVNESRALGGDVLSVGKYLSPKLYVGYGVSLLGTGQVMTLKYLLRKGFDIQIESSTVENRASLNWRKEK